MEFDGKTVKMHWLVMMVSIIITTVILTMGMVSWVQGKLDRKADTEQVLELMRKQDTMLVSLHKLEVNVAEIKIAMR